MGGWEWNPRGSLYNYFADWKNTSPLKELCQSSMQLFFFCFFFPPRQLCRGKKKKKNAEPSVFDYVDCESRRAPARLANLPISQTKQGECIKPVRSQRRLSAPVHVIAFLCYVRGCNRACTGYSVCMCFPACVFQHTRPPPNPTASVCLFAFPPVVVRSHTNPYLRTYSGLLFWGVRLQVDGAGLARRRRRKKPLSLSLSCWRVIDACH